MHRDPDQISVRAMSIKRQQRFLDAVARAARDARPAKARGRPTPQNLTPDGRTLGLSAMQASPRCRAKRRDGSPCKAPALKGATRCVKHGGRVEVPAHPHNIRRFFSGAMDRAGATQADKENAREHWDAMTLAERREFTSIVSERVLRNTALLHEAVQVWMVAKDGGYPAYKRFLDAFARA